MSEQQEDEYLLFISNFVHQLHNQDVSRKDAEIIASLAASCVLATVFHVQPEQDKLMDNWVVVVLKTAIKHFYGSKKVKSVC